MAGQGYSDEKQPPLYLKTTKEMLDEFKYLGEKEAEEIVIKNPQLIEKQIEELKPIPDEFYPPSIPDADKEIKEMAMLNARKMYGDKLPEIVEKRLNKELDSIIKNGFAVLYLIAHKLVKKSNEDGYLVGSRGSVGSSFAATMTGITEVNPLPPHYICPNCKKTIFITDGSYDCGVDMPEKKCDNCGNNFEKVGFNIPFEVFLGFKGDKVPDIDLNFSGEYQPKAHKYTEELFGKDYVFRAGTISTIAKKTAFGFAKNFCEDKNISIRNAELERLVNGCTGVKRTTGQHPGGLMVVPQNMDIHDFTPLQRPADDQKSTTITTHFDYHAISSRLVKLDILGHDDPTVIRMLEDLTGINAKLIPLDDLDTMKIFSGVETLGLKPEDINSNVGTFGIPEFGTRFVRGMLEETKPNTFSELVRISGFSHGTDVWLNNAQDIIKSGKANLMEAIACRDDIMTYLILKGLPSDKAFKIMEDVRKGKGLKDEYIQIMKENNVPEWYLSSCKKIKYMFPKAHAVAYVMMAFRIAYFKVHYPEAFYATFFSVKSNEFDADLVVKGINEVINRINDINNLGNNITAKEKNEMIILEIVLEMLKRGIKLLRVDLKKSLSYDFIITSEGLLPPFNALQGLGETAAKNIVEARKEKEFKSKEDLQRRAKLTKNVIEVLEGHGALKGLPDTSQIELFNIS
jgi:DNA polymerase-3 subunit alpha (Gram-positive type)